MRRLIPTLVLTLAVPLSGCATSLQPLAPKADGKELNAFVAAILEIAKDPACGHTDRVSLTFSPLPAGSLFLERDCPKPAPAAVWGAPGRPDVVFEGSPVVPFQ